MKLFIYGAGSTGREIVDIARRIDAVAPRWSEVLFADDTRVEREHYGVRVLRPDAMLAERAEFECIIAQGEPADRRRLYEMLRGHRVRMATVVDPSAVISGSASIGAGCLVGPHSFVSSSTRIGANVMVEIQTVVGHDIVVGDHSIVSSGSVLGGHTEIGEAAFIGLNCSVKERVRIGSGTIIGMGSCVFSDIGDGLIAVGNPARAVRRNEAQRVFKDPQAPAAGKA